MRPDRVSEDEMREAWAAKVNPWDKPKKSWPSASYSNWQCIDYREAVAKRKQAQTEKQAAFVAECTPANDEDRKILSFYAMGKNCEEIGKRLHLGKDAVRKRLKAMHPTGVMR
jgi:hypothetical protein